MTVTAESKHHANGVSKPAEEYILIVCPKCGKQYQIEKCHIPKHTTLVATCRACRHCFPMLQAVKNTSFKIPTDHRQSADSGQTTRTIAVSLSKGGVGKTTTAVNLSAGLALAGFKVLLVDTDTQGQDGFVLGVKPKVGLTDFLMGIATVNEAIFRARENLWLLAGGKSLAAIRRMIDQKDFGGEYMLSEALAPLENQYDFVIVDTSPGWDQLAVNVLFYVREILVPVSLEAMSLQGLLKFLMSVSAINKFRKEIALKYIVPTFLDDRVNSPAKILGKLHQLYGGSVCPPIRYHAGFAESPAFGQTIYEFDPGSCGAEDYRELVRRVADNDSLLR
jgi:chromosome partitioning protein